MIDILNNLYNLAPGLFAGCVILFVATVVYAIGVIKYTKKYIILNEELVRIKINNTSNKENI